MGRKVFALVVALSFFYIVSPLVLPIAMGAIFGVLFTPALDRLEKKGISRLAGSSLITSVATILVILPAAFLIFFAAKNGFMQLQAWKASPAPNKGLLNSFLDHPNIQHAMMWVSDYSPVEISDFAKMIHELAASIGAKLGEFLGSIITQIPGIVLSVIFMVLSMYFFLIDGRRLISFIRQNSFFNPGQTDHLIHTIKEICRSVVLAAFISGGIQALIEVFACVVTGTRNIALIGLSVFIASFIPIVGSLPVTLFVAFQAYLEGRNVEAIVLFITGLMIFAMDNAVRSIFLRGSANLHPFLAFVAAIGGLQTLGFVGVFIGPISAALFLTTLQVLTRGDGLHLPSHHPG